MINQRQFLGMLISLILACIVTGCSREKKQTERTEKGNQEIYTFSSYPVGTDDTATVHEYLRQAQLLVKDTGSDVLTRADSAISLARKAAVMSDHISYHEGLVDALMGIYILNFRLDRFTIGKDSLFLSITACNKIKDKELRDKNLVMLYNLLGSFYGKVSNYDSSFFYYLKAISLAESQQKPDTPMLIMLYDNAGFVNTASGYSIDADIAYLEKGLALALATKDSFNLGSLYHNIGNYFMQTKKQYDTAMTCWRKALTYKEAEGAGQSMQKVYLSMALHTMCNKGDVHLAGYYIDSARRSFKHDAINKADYTYQFILGEYQYHLGAFARAISFFKQSLRLSELSGDKLRLVNNYNNLAKCYDSIGRYRESSYYKTLALAGQQEIMNTTIARSIASVQAKYNLAGKDKVIAENQVTLLRQQNSLQRQYLLTGAIGLVAFLLIGTLSLLLFRKQQNVKMEKLKGMLVGGEQERKRLAQELHDGIVSQLSAIRMNLSALSAQHEVIRNTSGYTEALDQLEQGIRELRNTSHNLMPGILEQIGLVAAVKSFCINLSQSSKVAIEFLQIGEPPVLPAAYELHVYRILQELIFNIIKHSNATHVLVQFRSEGHHFQVTLDDNSTMQEEMVQERLHTGIGWYNIRCRMELLGGKMEEEHAPAGTSVYLEFDLNKKIEDQFSK